MPAVRLTLLIGGYAHRWHLGGPARPGLRHRPRLARRRPGRHPAAAPVLAQHRLAEAQPLVRGRARPRAPRPRRPPPRHGRRHDRDPHRPRPPRPGGRPRRPGRRACGLYERVLDAELLLVLAAEPRRTTSARDPRPRRRPLRPRLRPRRPARRLPRRARRPSPPSPAAASWRCWPGRGPASPSTSARPPRRILDAEAVGWLAEMAGHAPAETAARASRFARPDVAGARSSPPSAPSSPPWPTASPRPTSSRRTTPTPRPASSSSSPAPPEPDRPGIAAAIAEAVRFSGPEGVSLDVAFLDPGTPRHAAAARAGLRLELPRPPRAARPGHGPGPPAEALM